MKRGTDKAVNVAAKKLQHRATRKKFKKYFNSVVISADLFVFAGQITNEYRSANELDGLTGIELVIGASEALMEISHMFHHPESDFLNDEDRTNYYSSMYGLEGLSRLLRRHRIWCSDDGSCDRNNM